MKLKLITLIVALFAITGISSAQGYGRVIKLYKDGEMIYKSKIIELDSVKFATEYECTITSQILPKGSGFATINGSPDIQYIAIGDEATFVATSNNGYVFKNWTVNGEVVSTENPYTTAITEDAEYIANFDYDCVDLGLPSGLKWATHNIGASSPEEFGDYFAWGETSSKSVYYWETYKYCYGNYRSMNKYCVDSEYGTVDNKTTLELTDDVANVNWGGNWRMPTRAEQQELIDNCTWTWGTRNEVNGYTVTSKTNGNSIFIPAAGFRYGESLHQVGNRAYCSSSSLSPGNNSMAYNLRLSSSEIASGYDTRDFGCNVRAVCGSPITPPVPIYKVTVSSSDSSMGSVTASATGEMEEGSEVTLTATVNDGYVFKNWTVNGEVVSTENPYTATITATAEYVANFEYNCVDLGLSVKWATCNVGADSPEDYGNYFAWGETEAKEDYSWSNYKYYNGTETPMTKYCTNSDYGTVDNKTTLELADDAANVNWGGNWRMPTKAEQDELITNCTWTWGTMNGVNGYTVTSKTNGNSIFLPAAGYRLGSSLSGAGSDGSYWSSSLNESNSYSAYRLSFNSGSVNSNDYNRFSARSVRAVCE